MTDKFNPDHLKEFNPENTRKVLDLINQIETALGEKVTPAETSMPQKVPPKQAEETNHEDFREFLSDNLLEDINECPDEDEVGNPEEYTINYSDDINES